MLPCYCTTDRSPHYSVNSVYSASTTGTNNKLRSRHSRFLRINKFLNPSLHIYNHDGRRPSKKTYPNWILPSTNELLSQSNPNHLLKYLPYDPIPTRTTTTISYKHAGPCIHIQKNSFARNLLNNSQQWERARPLPTRLPRSPEINLIKIRRSIRTLWLRSSNA